MRLPDFLIIGAMKAGTTTLFRDLQAQRQVFFPYLKEPNNLCHDEVIGEKGLAEYARLFRDARADQLCAEGSTNYSKLPMFSGVSDRARRIIGPKLKIVYIVREPVSRTLSHHRDRYLSHKAPADLEEYLRLSDHPIQVSRYAMQIEPWIETFGRENIHIIQLESYSKNRHQELSSLGQFLGIDRMQIASSGSIHNASHERGPDWLVTGPVGRMRRTYWFRTKFRPLIPEKLISLIKRNILKTPPLPPAPGAEVIDRIIDAVRDDADRLRQIMGLKEPLWDFEAVRKKFVDSEQSVTVVTST